MTVKERVRASRVVEKARQNTAYADRIGFFDSSYQKTDKTANNAKS